MTSEKFEILKYFHPMMI